MANTTVYPFGQNALMPSGYPIADNLPTDSAQQALSARQGKVLNSIVTPFEEMNLTSMSVVSAVISNSQNKWVTNLTNYSCWFVPVTAGNEYKMKSHRTYATQYAFLTTDAHTNGNTPSYATGYSSALSLAANTEATLLAPSNAAYLYVLVNNEGNTTPQYIKYQVTKNVQERIEDNIVNDLTTGGATKSLSAEQGKVILGKIEPVALTLSSYTTHSAFITTTTNKWAVNYQSYACKLIPLVAGKRYILKANPSVGCGYALLSTDSYTDDTTPSYADGFTTVKYLAAGNSVELTTDNSGIYLYVYVYTTLDTTPESIMLQSDLEDKIIDAIEERANTKSQVPTSLKVGNKTSVIYTIDDFILAHDYVSGETDTLKASNDLGKTWTVITDDLTNDYGYLTNAFMFADGTFMMACKKDEGCRIYWSRDFETFTQATVLDYDGNPYSLEAGKTRFYILTPKSSHTYVNGIEHYCFWDYIISTTTNPRMWYAISDENGVTVRAAFAFGLSTLNGSTVPARHVHAFDYNPYNGYFYALTGDSVSECHVMKGRYTDNNGTHTWTWEKLATGGGYKLTRVSFDEGNLYAVTDYTEASLADAKGVVSIPIDKIGLTETNSSGVVCPAKIRYWFHATKSFMKQGSYYGSNATDAQIAALTGGIVDNHGWRFYVTDYLGSSKHLIAKGGHNFVWVDNDKGYKFSIPVGPNNNGDAYVSGGSPSNPSSSVSGEGWLRISHKGAYNLTEMMRNSGAVDFFDGWKGTIY